MQTTANMTISESYIPPIFSFSLPSIRNPASMSTSGYFSLTIFDSTNTPLYTWNPLNKTFALTNNGVQYTGSPGYGPIV